MTTDVTVKFSVNFVLKECSKFRKLCLAD